MKKYESGRSMIEMLAVLAVIGVITVGALSGYSQAMIRYKISRTVTDIVTLADELFKAYSWRRGYPSDVMTCKELKDEDIMENDTCTNPFGGRYEISGFGGDGGDKNPCLKIVVTGLKEDVCDQIRDEPWANVSLCSIADQPTDCNGSNFTIYVE